MSNGDTASVSKIIIDRDACTGAETCAVFAPDAFELDDKGIVTLKDSWRSHTDEDLIAAAKSCPTQAIKLIDQDGNEISLN